MTGSPLDLLRLLGSGLSALGGRSRSAKVSIDGSSFADLLEQAKAGQVQSGIPIRTADGVDLKLTPQQLDRLALAADRAEAQGAARALVMLDGTAIKLDVATRTITGTVDLSQSLVLSGFDTVISAPPPASAPGALPPPPANPAANASLLKVLEETSPAA